MKDQMSVVVRFVDQHGYIQERFLDIVHVLDTRSESLRSAVVAVRNRNELVIERLRGQGYDGASNMRGELNGLKALILQDNPSAFYVHCFCHRLQLALMSAAKLHPKFCKFFNDLNAICVTVSASAKRADQFRESQTNNVLEAFANGNLQTGRGLTQECSLRRAGDGVRIMRPLFD
jgi:hypothetical protein